eukprot:2813814-Amphidinium_carterae.1
MLPPNLDVPQAGTPGVLRWGSFTLLWQVTEERYSHECKSAVGVCGQQVALLTSLPVVVRHPSQTRHPASSR